MNLEKVKDGIRGPAYPVITAFEKNGNLDLYTTEKYIKFLCDKGAKIIYTMAHSSRLGLLSTQEIVKLNNMVCKTVKQYSGVVAIAATPMYRSTETCRFVAEQAELSGADVISVIFNERYYNDAQIIEFFKTIASSVNCGILIHEEQLNTIHGAARMNWPMYLLEQVVNINNVIAIKEDAKEDRYTDKLVTRFHNDVAIIVSGGSKEQFLEFAPLGCQAYLVGLGSVFPEISERFYEEYLKGNLDYCGDIVDKLERPFFEITKTLGWHIGLKSSMEHAGIMCRTERRPLVELDSMAHMAVGNRLRELELL
jgi:dihydrodipicolinate synthase/N-acetylneuraminate lyase